MKDLLFGEYSVHDAIEDVCSQKNEWLGLNQALTSCSFTVSLPYRCTAWSPSMMQYKTGGKQNTTTFSPMIIDKNIHFYGWEMWPKWYCTQTLEIGISARWEGGVQPFSWIR